MSRRPNALLALPASGPHRTVSSVPARSHVDTTTIFVNAPSRSRSLRPRLAADSQKTQHRYYFSSDRGFKPHQFHRATKNHSSVASDAAYSQPPDYTTPLLPLGQPQDLRPIQLNSLESALKTLFLDVAKHIHEKRLKEAPNNANIQPLQLRFTGGWVRDKLLGVDSNDIDLAVAGISSHDFAVAVMEYLYVPGNLKKYEEMGMQQTAAVTVSRIRSNINSSEHGGGYMVNVFGRYIDIFELRKANGMRGSAEEDAFRRDATINALFYNLNDSKVEDLTGRGYKDLSHRLIRTPVSPFRTLGADPARILRLIRLGAEKRFIIHNAVMDAMRDKDLAAGLRDKSRNRFVMTEMVKILKGPNPCGVLYLIDQLDLYSTLFTTDTNGFHADTSSWRIAYESLARLIKPRIKDDDDLRGACEHMRAVLFQNPFDTYNAWMITTLAPWITIPEITVTGTFRRHPIHQPHPPWAVEVAKDSFYPSLGNLVMLGEVSLCFRRVIEVKSAFLENRLGRTVEEIREQLTLHINSWGVNWRLSMIMAILQEIMTRHDFRQVIQEYDLLLKALEKTGRWE